MECRIKVCGMIAPLRDSSVREIRLREGVVAYVNACDYDIISRHKWRMSEHGSYAVTTVKSKNIRMHRMILGLTVTDLCHVDHVDGNGLNNCRSNLRVADAQKNAWNRRLSVRNVSSQYKAVGRKNTGKWEVRVRSGERCWCGSFESEELAARAYDVVAVAWFGEFANLNFPGDIEQSRTLVRESFKRFRVRKSRLDDVIFADVTSEATR